MVILDVAIVNVALPSMRSGLHFSTTGLQWVVNAYTLTFAGFLMLGGRSADLLGRRRVFLVGTALFALSSLACALADSRGLLITARGLQGLSGAVLSPATLSIITSSLREGPERNRGLAAWGAVGGLGASSGALLGGVLTQAFGWPAIFAVNVPLGLIVVALGLRVIPATARDEGTRHFDVTGAALVTASLVSLTYRDRPHRHARVGRSRRGRAADRRPGAAGRVLDRRGVCGRAAPGAALDLPDRALASGQLGGAAPVRRPVPGLVLPDPLPPAGAPLQRDRGGARLPADDAVDLHCVDACPADRREIRAAPR